MRLTLGSSATVCRIVTPIVCRYLDGTEERLSYRRFDEVEADCWRGTQDWSKDDTRFQLTDRWRAAADGSIALERSLTAAGAGAAFQLRLDVELDGGPWRFCAPAMLYGRLDAPHVLHALADHRLAYPLVTAYDGATREALTLLRASTARYDEAPEREPGQQRFTQRTDVGSLGVTDAGASAVLSAFWPWHEGDGSAALDAAGHPASAYRAVADEPLEVELRYELRADRCSGYAAAVRAGFARAVEIAHPAPVELPFTLEDSAAMRRASLAKTYVEWDGGGAGFVLNFDPDRSYDAEARAFGASFTVHGMGGSRDVLEYGFTGRQLNAALTLAEHDRERWAERAARVVDFFVERMTAPSGWVYTLYHRGKERPLCTCGDPDGPVMHYLAPSPAPGNYLRTMSEAVFDLLRNHRFQPHAHWLDACRRFADFLVDRQNRDGSWYRAYTPAGDPITEGAWFGDGGQAAKSATSVPITLLLELAAELDAPAYSAAATAAGEFLLAGPIARDDYRGGTLDNPNVVDKEAALLAMQAMLALHARTGDERHLEAASRAGAVALTWHLVWDVPNRPGTRLARAGVRSTGWGGINSTWGAGVTDIYSLFFLADLVRLGLLTGDPLPGRIAALAAAGCQQMLAHPGDLLGMADAGMQPEGIAFCDQGVDDALISKGDTWGGLGWPYTAGTFGLGQYLAALQRQDD